MWQSIQGHDAIAERFRDSLAAGRLASTYLFVGPEGIGKRSFALRLAAALLCREPVLETLTPCGACDSCRLSDLTAHPDLLLVRRPADKSFIPIDLLIGDREHRMRAGLCHDIALKPYLGGRKVAVIDDADYLNQEGANSLLKTLEEPPPRSLLILIGTSAARQLPTIRSRCQVVRFAPLPGEVVARLLLEQEVVTDEAEAERLALLAGGSLTRAAELADPVLQQFRGRLLHALSADELESLVLARQVTALVDDAGREAAARRARLRQVLGFAAEYYRELMRQASGLPACADSLLADAAARGAGAGTLSAEGAADHLGRTLDALDQLGRNANQTTLVECWLDDLARLQLAATG